MAVPYPCKLTIPQMPNCALEDKLVTINSTYIEDTLNALDDWNCSRVVIFASRSSDENTDKVRGLVTALRTKFVGKIVRAVGDLPAANALEVAKLLHQQKADTLICIGANESHADIAKIARLVHATFTYSELNKEDALRLLIDSSTSTSLPLIFKPPKTKLILVPRSLSVSEYNPVSSVGDKDGTKLGFGTADSISALPDLILLDPKVAWTAPPQHTFIPSGARAIEHAIETICCRTCEDEGLRRAKDGLKALIQGLRTYSGQLQHGKSEQSRKSSVTTSRNEVVTRTSNKGYVEHVEYGVASEREQFILSAISACQQGTRDAIAGAIAYRSVFGPSHAIGHQLAEHTNIPFAFIPSIILPAVLKYEKHIDPVGRMWNVDKQREVLSIFNQALGWSEYEAGMAVEKFFRTINLPVRFSEIETRMLEDKGEEESQAITQAELMRVSFATVYQDRWMGGPKQIEDPKAVLQILESVR